MDAQTGSGGNRRAAGAVFGHRAPAPRVPARGPMPPTRRSDRRAAAGPLLTAVVLPLLPAVLLGAVASVAASSHTLATAVPDDAASPLAPVLAQPSPALTALAGLALAAFVLGLPVSAHAGLLVGGGALLGHRVPADAAWRRALRRVPATLALLLPCAALGGALVWGAPRLAQQASWPALAAAATALTALVLLLSSLVVGVLADLSPPRALAEVARTVRDRSTARLAAPVRAALPSPAPGDARGVPAPIPVLACLALVLPLAAPGPLWPGVSDAPPASNAAVAASAQTRTTVQIEDGDGGAHTFEVGPEGLREVGCGPGCVTGPVEPGGGAHVDDDGSHARVGGRVVAAYWRADPGQGPATLYLRVCGAAPDCSDEPAPAASGTPVSLSPVPPSPASEAAASGVPGALVGSRVEVLRDGSARVLGCADPCAQAGASAPADAGRAGPGSAAKGTGTATGRSADGAGVVTVQVSGPDTLRLVMLSCEPHAGTDCGTGA